MHARSNARWAPAGTGVRCGGERGKERRRQTCGVDAHFTHAIPYVYDY